MRSSNPAGNHFSDLSHTAPANVLRHGIPVLTGALVLTVVSASSTAAFAAQKEPARQLVREVVYNELHDHDAHGYWSYWVHQSLPGSSQVAEMVETPVGPIRRVLLHDGHPLDPQNLHVQQAKLEKLASSTAEQEHRHEAYQEDEQRVRRILAILPDAFCFEEAGEENGIRHVRFRPNPDYPAHTIEGRVIHQLNGDLWIDARMKRMTRIEGRLDRDLTFGMGLLGRVDKGSWFKMQRRQVSPTEWKTESLEVHMTGRALFFKTIARETSEVRGGFTRLPANFSVAQSVRMLEKADPFAVAAEFAPVSLPIQQKNACPVNPQCAGQ